MIAAAFKPVRTATVSLSAVAIRISPSGIIAARRPSVMKLRFSALVAASLATSVSPFRPSSVGTEHPNKPRTDAIARPLSQNPLRHRRQLQPIRHPRLSSTSTPSEITQDSHLAAPGTPPGPSDSSTTKNDVDAVIAKGNIVSIVANDLFAVKVDVEDYIATESIRDNSLSPHDGLARINIENEPTKIEQPSTGKLNLSGDLTGRSAILPDGATRGVVVAHRPPIAFVYSSRNDVVSRSDGTVQILAGLENVSVDMRDTVRILDCFGNRVDLGVSAATKPASESSEGPGSDAESIVSRQIYAAIPQVKDIALINTPLITGITMFDVLAPIGNGQNMLMIGHDRQDMGGYVRDFLCAQKQSGTKRKCVYAVTSDAKQVAKSLADAGLMDDITLVVPASGSEEDADVRNASSKAAEAVTISATACAIGEMHALERGEDALVIIDSIDQQKSLWDMTTQVLVDVFGVDAVVKSDREGGASSEMRAFYSSLIQRSAQYKKKRGGGSVTLVMLTTIPRLAGSDDDDRTVFDESDFANMGDKIRERIALLVKRNIPLTSANLRKVGIPIPSDAEGKRRLALQHVDDLISMSDGQIWLDELLEGADRRPCMDPQRSITRVGIGADTDSRADAPALRRIVEGLRLDLAQAASMDGADVGTAASVKQIRRAKALMLVMHQPSGAGGRTLSESCVVVLAASKCYLDPVVDEGIEAGSAEARNVLREMVDYVRNAVPDALSEIDTTLDMTAEVQASIEEALKKFFDNR